MALKFGNLREFEDLNREVQSVVNKPLMESAEADEEAAKTEDVVVPTLHDGKFHGREKGREVAAGNTPDNEPVKEAQLGCMDMKKPAVVEAFEENEAIDEDSMKTAKENASPFHKTADFFNDVFDKRYIPTRNKKFDLDATKERNVVSDKPIRKIPKGW